MLCSQLIFVGKSACADDTFTAPTVDTYFVQPDDVLSITVIGFTDLTQPEVVVLQDGTITVPLLGSVTVQGLTPAAIQATLTKQWKKYVINPSVTVSLIKKHPQYVTFSGWVLHPGTTDYRTNYHVIEALSEDGGALPTGDMSKVTVSNSSTQTKQILDLSHPETKAGTDLDIILNPNDEVYVPELRDEFSVVGEVKNPGSYPYKENMTVLDALTDVGGTLQDADLSDAKLMHDGNEGPIDLDALLRHGDLTKNIQLSAGDRITVPEGDRVYVYGAVQRPGYYNFKPGDTVLDAMNAAGGPTPTYAPSAQPDLAKINLIRVDKAAKKATIHVIDLQRFLNKGDLSQNVSLQPGDVLYVPTKSHKMTFQDVTGMLSGIGEGAYLISAAHGL